MAARFFDVEAGLGTESEDESAEETPKRARDGADAASDSDSDSEVPARRRRKRRRRRIAVSSDESDDADASDVDSTTGDIRGVVASCADVDAAEAHDAEHGHVHGRIAVGLEPSPRLPRGTRETLARVERLAVAEAEGVTLETPRGPWDLPAHASDLAALWSTAQDVVHRGPPRPYIMRARVVLAKATRAHMPAVFAARAAAAAGTPLAIAPLEYAVAARLVVDTEQTNTATGGVYVAHLLALSENTRGQPKAVLRMLRTIAAAYYLVVCGFYDAASLYTAEGSLARSPTKWRAVAARVLAGQAPPPFFDPWAGLMACTHAFLWGAGVGAEHDPPLSLTAAPVVVAARDTEVLWTEYAVAAFVLYTHTTRERWVVAPAVAAAAPRARVVAVLEAAEDDSESE